VINLAHGSFYMLGAYLAFVLAPAFGDWYLSKLLVGTLLAALFGYLLAGDRLTPIQLAGGAIMLAAIAALLRPDKEALTRP